MFYRAEGAVVRGEVQAGKDCSIWYNAVLRADQPIRLGDRVNIQDGCILHSDHSAAVMIGNDVTIGHGAIIHGCTIEHSCIIGMGAIIMNRAVIRDHCIVGAGSLITEGKTFPPGSLILGTPAKAVRPLTEEEKNAISASAMHYVHQAETELSGTDF